MKLPESVYVCGLRVEVKKIKKMDAYGRYFRGSKIIKVEAGQSPDQERDTLLHECIHAMEDALNMPLTEEQVSKLAHGVLTTLRGNPKFAQYLLEQ